MQSELPIEAFKAAIMACNKPYIIVEAETGSGKSTMVPQWFHALGLRVLVTEPLIETVVGTSEYVAELMGVKFGTIVGYRTGREANSSPETEILFCTDGLALVRGLSGNNRFDILIIDELHEWNVNQSTLEAWAWQHLEAGNSPFQKIVVLSATLDSAELSRKRDNAPVFKIPGRQYPITDVAPGGQMSADVAAMVAAGHDVLVFQPGKAEISELIEELEERGVGAELIPFHGGLDRESKRRAYREYGCPKVVVSTNALETGRTLLPSTGRLLVVIDSGMERRVEVENGIEALVLAPIANARSRQRRGRTGRVGDGIYIDHCQTAQREDYPTPEILRTRLDQTVLRLAVAGYDASSLPFFHELRETEINSARKALIGFGAMTKDGEVTETGRRMSRLPVEVHYARMIIEAQERGVVNAVLTIIACLEADGIRDKGQKQPFGRPLPPRWPKLTDEENSDLLAEFDCYVAACSLSRTEVREHDINLPRFERAQKIRAQLVDRLAVESELGVEDDRQEVLRACVAGMVDRLYRFSVASGRYAMEGDDNPRELDQLSVIKRGDWVVGIGWDLHFKRKVRPTRWELEDDPDARPHDVDEVKHLLKFASVIDLEWLADYMPPEDLEAKVGHAPETITVDDITFHITYEKSSWSMHVGARVRIALSDLERVTKLPTLPKADSVERIDVVAEDGTLVASGDNLLAVHQNLTEREAQAKKRAEQEALYAEVRELEVKYREMEARGRPVESARQLLATARSEVGSMLWSWHSGNPTSSIGRVRTMLERLDQQGVDVLLEDLMAGRIAHPGIRANMLTVQKINAYAIRSAGFIEALTDDLLRQLYRDRLGDATTVQQALQVNLRLRLEDYAPADLLEDPELDLAPDALEVQGRKGATSYTVTYGYELVDGRQTAVGVIQVPISIYEQNCAESGRKSQFPTLPHEIRLVIEVTEQNQLVARGEDDEQLRSKVKKHRRNKKRSGTTVKDPFYMGMDGLPPTFVR